MSAKVNEYRKSRHQSIKSLYKIIYLRGNQNSGCQQVVQLIKALKVNKILDSNPTYIIIESTLLTWAVKKNNLENLEIIIINYQLYIFFNYHSAHKQCLKKQRIMQNFDWENIGKIMETSTKAWYELAAIMSLVCQKKKKSNSARVLWFSTAIKKISNLPIRFQSCRYFQRQAQISGCNHQQNGLQGLLSHYEKAHQSLFYSRPGIWLSSPHSSLQL